jgi:hypothetical protein
MNIVPRLVEVPGVVGLVLGGSRARGTAVEASDYDLGLYYGSDEPLDTDGLLAAVRHLVDDPASAAVTAIGEWGPRIVGGGWLSIQEHKVDLLYRSVEDVRAVIAECREGRISMAYQAGHPHGFCSAIWMGEVALCQPLYDSKGMIAELKAATSPYPAELRATLVKTFLWEMSFSIEDAQLAIPRSDKTHIAGCVYRSLGRVGQVLFAINHRYLINEKRALAEAAGFPSTIDGLTARIDAVWKFVGQVEFAPALEILRALDSDLRALVRTRG